MSTKINPAIARFFSREQLRVAKNWRGEHVIDIPDDGPVAYPDPLTARASGLLKRCRERGKPWRPDVFARGQVAAYARFDMPDSGVKENLDGCDFESRDSTDSLCPMDLRARLEAADVARERRETSRRDDEPARPRIEQAPPAYARSRKVTTVRKRQLEKGLTTILESDPYRPRDGKLNKRRLELFEIVDLTLAGKSSREIARQLNIPLRTVERRLETIRRAAEDAPKFGGV